MVELIVNPIAGNGRSKQSLASVKAELTGRGLAHHVSFTETAGDGARLTRRAVMSRVEIIAVLGGDGLLSEVAQAIMNTGVRLIFVPCGTGNDFIKALKLPNDPLKALKLQLDSPERLIDCGTVNEFAFMNIAGTGFDIEVLKETEHVKSMARGIWPYIYGLISGIKRFRPFDAEVTIDGVTEHRRYTIISVANGRYFGGGMLVAPFASTNDGKFDVMLVDEMPMWKFYMILLLFVPGKHVWFKCVRRVLAEDVVIKCKNSFTIEIDGELKDVPNAHFSVRKQAIKISCPEV